MTTGDKRNPSEFVKGILVAAITKPSRRDKQKSLGPSDIANQCDFCLGKKIAESLGIATHTPDRNHNMRAWLGTAVHEKLERDVRKIYPGIMQEFAVEVGDVPLIGRVIGHVDAYEPSTRTLIDWKITRRELLDKYKKTPRSEALRPPITKRERVELNGYLAQDRTKTLAEGDMARYVELLIRHESATGGLPENYRVQQMLYMYALRRGGYPAEHTCLAFIPTDSINVDDTWVSHEVYDPEIAVEALARATRIAGMVRTHRLGELPVNPSCYPCSARPRSNRKR